MLDGLDAPSTLYIIKVETVNLLFDYGYLRLITNSGVTSTSKESYMIHNKVYTIHVVDSNLRSNIEGSSPKLTIT